MWTFCICARLILLPADFKYFVLRLPDNGTNYRVNFNTCASLTADPDMCVGTEYFDDAQSPPAEQSSNAQGACSSRPDAVDDQEDSRGGANSVRLGENGTYVMAPGDHAVQIGTYGGTGNVTLGVACQDTDDAATELDLDLDDCYGERTNHSRYPTQAPSTSGPTVTPSTQPTTVPSSSGPTALPTSLPTSSPLTGSPTTSPASSTPSQSPTVAPTTLGPTATPTANPTAHPIATPTANPTVIPTARPTAHPTATPTANPTVIPTANPTASPAENATVACNEHLDCPSSDPVCIRGACRNCTSCAQCDDGIDGTCGPFCPAGASEADVRPLCGIRSVETDCTAACPDGYGESIACTDPVPEIILDSEDGVGGITFLPGASDGWGARQSSDTLKGNFNSTYYYHNGRSTRANATFAFDVAKPANYTIGVSYTYKARRCSTVRYAVHHAALADGSTFSNRIVSQLNSPSDCRVVGDDGTCVAGFEPLGSFPLDRNGSVTLFVEIGQGSVAADAVSVLATDAAVRDGRSTKQCTLSPTASPTTLAPTAAPTDLPTAEPTRGPTVGPTHRPSVSPASSGPSAAPTPGPTSTPTVSAPTSTPTSAPTGGPTLYPTAGPTTTPSAQPTSRPTRVPTAVPTASPTIQPTTAEPTHGPSETPTSSQPTSEPSAAPVTPGPTQAPTTASPTATPTALPSGSPSLAPTYITCAGWGDPHYITYDGYSHSFQGECEFTLVQHATARPNEGFEVQVQNSMLPAAAAPQMTQTMAISVVFGDATASFRTIRLSRSSLLSAHRILWANGSVTALPSLPYVDGNLNEIRSIGGSHYGGTDAAVSVLVPHVGAEVIWDGSSVIRVLIEENSVLINGSLGLCGDTDGDASNDAILISQNSHFDANMAARNHHDPVMGAGSCMRSTGADPVSTVLPTADDLGSCPDAQSHAAAMEYCAPLGSTDVDRYGDCATKIDPLPFYRTCLHDHCKTGSEGLACDSMSVYEELCGNVGGVQIESVRDLCGVCYGNNRSCSSCSETGDVDVVLVLDASGSVNRSDFAMLKSFALGVISGLPIGPDDIRSAVVLQHSDGEEVLSLSQGLDKLHVEDTLRRLPYSNLNRGTGTLFALEHVRDVALQPTNGFRGGESYVLVITEGQDPHGAELVGETAATLEAAYGTRIAMLHSPRTTIAYAEAIVSQPEYRFEYSNLHQGTTDALQDRIIASILGDCGTGTYLTQECQRRLHVERICTPCLECATERFETAPCTATTNRECAGCSEQCLRNQMETSSCTPTSDRVCERCLVCTDSEYETAPCTLSTDRECADCGPECTAEEWLSTPCGETNPTVCSTCSPPCGINQIEQAPCTATSDRVCTACAIESCETEQFELVPCTSTTERVCAGCNEQCLRNQVETSPCTPSSNRVCERCQTCSDSEYESSPCTLTADRGCTDCGACADDEYQFDACSADQPPVCVACEPCDAELFEVAACTATTDKVCERCNERCLRGFFESVHCTPTSNRECQRCRPQCAAPDVERSQCEESSDRTCFTPTSPPTFSPTAIPTHEPTGTPTVSPTQAPSTSPTPAPTQLPTFSPSTTPTPAPTVDPTRQPSQSPTMGPSLNPTFLPTVTPTRLPTENPTTSPSARPTTSAPTGAPTADECGLLRCSRQCPPTMHLMCRDCTVGEGPCKSVDGLTGATTCQDFVDDVRMICEVGDGYTLCFDEYIADGRDVVLNTAGGPRAFGYCGWDSDTNLCRNNSETTIQEYMALIPAAGDPSACVPFSPTTAPTHFPSVSPTPLPTSRPTVSPTLNPSVTPTSSAPTSAPTAAPTQPPTVGPTSPPTSAPTAAPTQPPTPGPTPSPTPSPSRRPCNDQQVEIVPHSGGTERVCACMNGFAAPAGDPDNCQPVSCGVVNFGASASFSDARNVGRNFVYQDIVEASCAVGFGHDNIVLGGFIIRCRADGTFEKINPLATAGDPTIYTGAGPGLACDDIDECAQSSDLCDDICDNYAGGFRCLCGPGGFMVPSDPSDALAWDRTCERVTYPLAAQPPPRLVGNAIMISNALYLDGPSDGTTGLQLLDSRGRIGPSFTLKLRFKMEPGSGGYLFATTDPTGSERQFALYVRGGDAREIIMYYLPTGMPGPETTQMRFTLVDVNDGYWHDLHLLVGGTTAVLNNYVDGVNIRRDRQTLIAGIADCDEYSLECVSFIGKRSSASGGAYGIRGVVSQAQLHLDDLITSPAFDAMPSTSDVGPTLVHPIPDGALRALGTGSRALDVLAFRGTEGLALPHNAFTIVAPDGSFSIGVVAMLVPGTTGYLFCRSLEDDSHRYFCLYSSGDRLTLYYKARSSDIRESTAFNLRRRIDNGAFQRVMLAVDSSNQATVFVEGEVVGQEVLVGRVDDCASLPGCALYVGARANGIGTSAYAMTGMVVGGVHGGLSIYTEHGLTFDPMVAHAPVLQTPTQPGYSSYEIDSDGYQHNDLLNTEVHGYIGTVGIDTGVYSLNGTGAIRVNDNEVVSALGTDFTLALIVELEPGASGYLVANSDTSGTRRPFGLWANGGSNQINWYYMVAGRTQRMRFDTPELFDGARHQLLFSVNATTAGIHVDGAIQTVDVGAAPESCTAYAGCVTYVGQRSSSDGGAYRLTGSIALARVYPGSFREFTTSTMVNGAAGQFSHRFPSSDVGK